MTPGPLTRPEVWGGIECTHNRVGGRFHSQLDASGHSARIEADLDRFVTLGIARLRYPVLWERVEAVRGVFDFRESDRALGHLGAGPVRPVVGLLHHGSGPAWTSLDDEGFPERFAVYAEAVARRYPWVDDYTPINEPLTTARFSGLYGHWYPHGRNDGSFVRMLVLQARATVLAMRSIRRVNPAARLIQTEDLGRATGTPPLEDQVTFENDRRWLTFDLLSGKVTPQHPLHDYLTSSGGADAAALAWFVDHPSVPGVLGINHYPRSNRWLDHRRELFDPADHGGNGRMAYADVAASDVALAVAPTLSSLIRETSARYGGAVAVTEIHVDGDAVARVAWWEAALGEVEHARSHGSIVCAVTAWSLLGSFDWDTLCTSVDASADRTVTYEAGVFDVSAGEPAETPMAEAVRRAYAPNTAPVAARWARTVARE
ncbi:hypothetical protein ACFM35_10650 [Microbacterium sp. P01]|uniref:hypothetical protein n=1 Tax=Microbacterium sp. P01 TaxID=3366261 RepID=UPI00366A6BF3